MDRDGVLDFVPRHQLGVADGYGISNPAVGIWGSIDMNTVKRAHINTHYHYYIYIYVYMDKHICISVNIYIYTYRHTYCMVMFVLNLRFLHGCCI